MGLLVVSILQGIWAYFAGDLRKIFSPIHSKFLHNVTSILCFLFGMVSLIYGYVHGMMKAYETDEVRYLLIAIAVITSFLTLINPMKSILNTFKHINNTHQ